MDDSVKERNIGLEIKSIEKCFRKLKRTILKVYGSLTDDEREWLDLYSSTLLTHPIKSNCLLIWINEPFEYQWIIDDFFNKEKISGIKILGPYKAKQIISCLMEELENKTIKESQIKDFINFIVNQEFFENNKQCINDDISGVFIKGNIIDYDFPLVVQDIFNNTLQIKTQGQNDGFITWLKRPNESPFCLGERTNISLKDTVQDKLFEFNKITEYVINVIRFAIFSDGQITCITDKDSEIKDIANAFLSILNIKSNIVFSPLEEKNFNRTSLSFETMEYLDQFWKIKPGFEVISTETIRESLKMTKHLLSFPTLLQSYILLLESHNHMEQGDYSQSFHMSWVILEIHIGHLWVKLIEENHSHINHKQKKELERWNKYKTSTSLEILNLIGIVSASDYQKITKWRDSRNNFVHQGKNIPSNDCKEIYDFVKQKLIDRSVELGLNFP
jgi:hypothetical protein